MYPHTLSLPASLPIPKRPSTVGTPAGSSDVPAFSALRAPASTLRRPTGFRLPAIQRLRAVRGSTAARNQVQRAPSATACRGLRRRPLASAMRQPDPVAILPATRLVIIPPGAKIRQASWREGVGPYG